MNIRISEKISAEILAWCINTFGKSRYHSAYPMVFTRYELNKRSRVCGEYDPSYNVIVIYTKLTNTPRQLINTIIHEYVHYLQCPRWISRYMKIYGSSTNKNPYEAVAYMIAKDMTNICEQQTRSRINKWLEKKK